MAPSRRPPPAPGRRCRDRVPAGGRSFLPHRRLLWGLRPGSPRVLPGEGPPSAAGRHRPPAPSLPSVTGTWRAAPCAALRDGCAEAGRVPAAGHGAVTPDAASSRPGPASAARTERGGRPGTSARPVASRAAGAQPALLKDRDPGPGQSSAHRTRRAPPGRVESPRAGPGGGMPARRGVETGGEKLLPRSPRPSLPTHSHTHTHTHTQTHTHLCPGRRLRGTLGNYFLSTPSSLLTSFLREGGQEAAAAAARRSLPAELCPPALRP